ncbi:hypothetical protein DYB26_012598 [Aphanomyces astaci]|uniref:EamA domain-containing protein n=1 Tax=Aphanomyces astaci TaxID=112090 RepID=A0A418G4B3_APHAT|nr:hypothetical protein DYB26_012598 [Aphanomyces astaci]
MTDQTRGVMNGAVAYVIWGLCPVYWKLLATVPAIQLIAHRIGWSVPLLVLMLALRGELHVVAAAVQNRRTMATYALSASLLGVSYFVCVWAVNAGFIVDVSLGMYINPLVSVLLGVFFCKETLNTVQWLAMVLAAAGMLAMAIDYGKFPWIAFTIALDFGLYGLVQKKAPLGALPGVTIEFVLLSVPLVVYLLVVDQQGDGAFGHTGAAQDWLMAGLGATTVVPQVMFAASAQSIPLSILGILQFLGPTISVLLGVLVYDEAFGTVKALSFGLVWLGLILFTTQSVRSPKVEQPISLELVVVSSVRLSAAEYIAAVDDKSVESHSALNVV